MLLVFLNFIVKAKYQNTLGFQIVVSPPPLPSLFLRHTSLLQLNFHDIRFQDFGFLRVAVVSLFSLTIHSFVLSFQPILGHYLTNGTFFATIFIFIMLCY